MNLQTKKSPPKLRTPNPSRDDADVARDKVCTVRLSEEEFAAWHAVAKAEQRKLGDWIRVVVNANASVRKAAAAAAAAKKGGAK